MKILKHFTPFFRTCPTPTDIFSVLYCNSLTNLIAFCVGGDQFEIGGEGPVPFLKFLGGTRKKQHPVVATTLFFSDWLRKRLYRNCLKTAYTWITGLESSILFLFSKQHKDFCQDQAVTKLYKNNFVLKQWCQLRIMFPKWRLSLVNWIRSRGW